MQVELLDFTEQEKAVTDLSVAERISEASSKKAKGVDQFKAGNKAACTRSWSRVVALVEDLYSEEDDSTLTVRPLHT